MNTPRGFGEPEAMSRTVEATWQGDCSRGPLRRQGIDGGAGFVLGGRRSGG